MSDSSDESHKALSAESTLPGEAPADRTPRAPLPAGPSRRAFLTGAGAAAMAGLAAACAGDGNEPDVATSAPQTDVVSQSAPGPTTPPSTAPPLPAEAAPPNDTDEPQAAVEFGGAQQQGVLHPPAAAGLVAAFDIAVVNRDELAETMQTLSAEVARLMIGSPSEQDDEFLPPVDSGAIGADSTTAGVAITVGVGASLFDDRFGLAELRPRELIAMPRFFNDRLIREDMSHGDLSVTVSGPNQQAVVFALHQIVRVTERRLRLRWVQEGYNHLLPDRPAELSQSRNLMGFRDGTSNPDVADDDAMNDHVWVQPNAGEPAWATGGTYQAVRVIRMLIEFWATAALVRQEQIFGRHRDTGAPLGQDNEADDPVYTANPDADVIPRRAHIRLANPRTPGSPSILRRGFNYLNGASADGTMDQGLLFVCYQSSLTRGFLEVQSRLDGEPLEDYIKPVGGGLFFVLPGPGESDGWLGQSLLG